MSATIDRVPSFDGIELAVHKLGEGRPVLLLHGLFSSAQTNWIRFGTAQKLAEAGFACLMPELRAHGHSGAPHDPAAYPPGVLARDAAAIAAHYDLSAFDLVGFSLGARTAVAAVLDGLAPRRLVLGGMGLSSLSNWPDRSGWFCDVIDNFETIAAGDERYFAKAFMKTQKIDRVAARLLLKSDPGLGSVAGVTMPTLVVCGAEDDDNGSGRELAEALPDARFVEVPGTHMSSITEPAFGQAIVDFLTEG